MQISRRSGLAFGLGAIGATFIPRFAMAQGDAPQDGAAASFAYPVEGGEVVFHPVDHASMAITTPGGTILVDPVGGAAAYAAFRPSLILITHQHGDHFDLPTLEGLPQVRLITNPAVHDQLPDAMKARASVMANGDQAAVIGVEIEAVPAYNTTADRLEYHPKGRDNGYILTIGGKRFYIAGDTEDTPEMRALEDIHVAFLPMNLPYTMTIEQAADAVDAFRPGTVFPYHHRGSDVQAFAALVERSKAPTLVVVANWYPNGEAG